ncbi:MAG: YHS domain-containing (seleno)protein [Aliishimia sp.]
MSLSRRLFMTTFIAATTAFPVFASDVPELNLSRSGLALRGVDPVSYFEAGKPLQGRKDIVLDYKGGTYRFGSQETLALFKSNPEKYLPAFGGYCAYGTAVNTKVDGDPNVWHIVDGQLYLNINRSVDRVWQRNIPRYLRDANKNWPNIRDD